MAEFWYRLVTPSKRHCLAKLTLYMHICHVCDGLYASWRVKATLRYRFKTLDRKPRPRSQSYIGIMSHARPILFQLHHATRPILVKLHHATRSCLKFRNYQRSLFKAKNFPTRLVPFFSIHLVIRVVRDYSLPSLYIIENNLTCNPKKPICKCRTVIVVGSYQTSLILYLVSLHFAPPIAFLIEKFLIYLLNYS